MKKILQAFKRLFYRETYYICDPKKAVHCTKKGCWDLYHGPCKCTSRKKYAKLDDQGKPMVASDIDVCNIEWMESKLI